MLLEAVPPSWKKVETSPSGGCSKDKTDKRRKLLSGSACKYTRIENIRSAWHKSNSVRKFITLRQSTELRMCKDEEIVYTGWLLEVGRYKESFSSERLTE